MKVFETPGDPGPAPGEPAGGGPPGLRFLHPRGDPHGADPGGGEEDPLRPNGPGGAGAPRGAPLGAGPGAAASAGSRRRDGGASPPWRPSSPTRGFRRWCSSTTEAAGRWTRTLFGGPGLPSGGPLSGAPPGTISGADPRTPLGGADPGASGTLRGGGPAGPGGGVPGRSDPRLPRLPAGAVPESPSPTGARTGTAGILRGVPGCCGTWWTRCGGSSRTCPWGCVWGRRTPSRGRSPGVFGWRNRSGWPGNWRPWGRTGSPCRGTCAATTLRGASVPTPGRSGRPLGGAHPGGVHRRGDHLRPGPGAVGPGLLRSGGGGAAAPVGPRRREGLEGGRGVRIFISADMEGCTGLVRPCQVDAGTEEYALGRAMMLHERAGRGGDPAPGGVLRGGGGLPRPDGQPGGPGSAGGGGAGQRSPSGPGHGGGGPGVRRGLLRGVPRHGGDREGGFGPHTMSTVAIHEVRLKRPAW